MREIVLDTETTGLDPITAASVDDEIVKLRDLQEAGQTLRVAKLRQETARENMRVSLNKYKAVATLFSNVLQTQATLADADYEYQKALLSFWTAKAEYEKSIGLDK